MSPEFENIADRRQRLLARLNWSMRPGTVNQDESPLVYDAIMASTHNLTDFDRRVLAEHLLAAIEDEGK